MLFAALYALSLWADERTNPMYQIADNSFFDPTQKKEQKEDYHFHMEYRVEAGYAQHQQRAETITFPDLYLHGARLGGTCTFTLPMHFGLEAGVLYTLLYGTEEQHWRSIDAPTVQEEYINHRVLAHHLTIPVRVYYTIPLWKQLNLFFFTGPQLHVGLAQNDYLETHLSDGARNWLEKQGVAVTQYDRMADELVRANIQWGLGGGLEWDRYRLQSGYDFGLNNLVKQAQIPNQYMAEWGWFVTFCYRF